MNIFKTAQAFRQLPTLVALAKAAKPLKDDTKDCIGARVESTARRFPNRSAVVFEGKELNWSELNAESNRAAKALQDLGLKRGDCVALMMENRIEFLSTFIALNKLGIKAALINTNVSGRALSHCLTITDARYCLFGDECADQVQGVHLADELENIESWLYIADGDVSRCPDWAEDFGTNSELYSSTNPADSAENRLSDNALYIFTSGTTGLPKAAVVSNKRALFTSLGAAIAGLRCTSSDRIYICLPLYHATALFMGVGAACVTGASVFLRRRFSASEVLNEVREHRATMFIYIGEICRYLLNTPQLPDDNDSPLVTIMGNGLRPDIWLEFKARFGISRVSEFYGSSEGNIAFFNLFNRDCTVGVSPAPHALVKYDIESDEIVRDSEGRCIRVEPGQPGLLLGKITKQLAFEGYTSREATEKKIVRDVFNDGDAWYNSGDLLKIVDAGFAFGMQHYQFVDRIGDTFRWKGENVSTNEVAEVINTHPQVQFSNVYGVEIPGTDGRAGMAALLLEESETSLDLESFSELICEQLPAYARPVFLRILPAMDTTGTFKMLKNELREQRFEPGKVSGPVMIMDADSNGYQLLSDERAVQILAGSGGF